MSSANQNKPFSWNLPELSIRDAGQGDRSSGYENASVPSRPDDAVRIAVFKSSQLFKMAEGHAPKKRQVYGERTVILNRKTLKQNFNG